MKTHYDILGVKPSASQQEIKDAYLIRSKMMHPDRFSQVRQPNEWALANQFLQELNEAYGVLRDRVTRVHYDESIKKKEAAPAPPVAKANSVYTQFPSVKKSGTDFGAAVIIIPICFLIFLIAFVSKLATGSGSNTSAPSNTGKIPLLFTPLPTPLVLPKVDPLSPRKAEVVTTNWIEPRTDTILRNFFRVGGKGTLTLINGTHDHAVVKILKGTSNSCEFECFVRANETGVIRAIPDGEYRLLFSLGHGWDNISRRFFRRRGSSIFDDPIVFSTRTQREGGYDMTYFDKLQVTLNPVINGNTPISDIADAEFDNY